MKKLLAVAILIGFFASNAKAQVKREVKPSQTSQGNTMQKNRKKEMMKELNLSKEQRAKLFPTIGRLFPEGNNLLAKSDELDQVRQVCENVSEYKSFFDNSGSSQISGGASSNDIGSPELAAAAQLEDRFFHTEVHLNKLAFLQQFQYGVFYSYMKLKEQEIRNLTWIAECIAQDARDRMQDFIPIF